MTIDVEDWFQVENFKPWIGYSTWRSQQLRVERNIHLLLDLFDSVTLTGPAGATSLRATFFVLGWIAERCPHLVKTIQKRGHEIASHGYSHGLCADLPDADLKRDLVESKRFLEDLTGEAVLGYRAPSFAVDDHVLELVKESGYLYDSSYNSFDRHGRYGQIDLSGKEKRGIGYRISSDFYELPISNLKVAGQVAPWGGGGYFRLMPLFLTKAGVRSILKKEGAYLFYTHPWEFDPDQPRVAQATRFRKFRHYVNLKHNQARLLSFMNAFRECRYMTLKAYLCDSI